MFLIHLDLAIQIREQDPLKQGLKHGFDVHLWKFGGIREQDPLKQGLKQTLVKTSLRGMTYSRARSIKTRIETCQA